jgi:hypothetical protein
MLALVISPAIREKLSIKHSVQDRELHECFMNHHGKYLVDLQEQHATDPPTVWFIGETYRGRKLKIVFVHKDGNIYIKSAYDANAASMRIYNELNSGD